MKRKLILGAFTVLLMMCVCALGGCSGKKTINLADYVSVEYSGYSGDGTAVVHIDTDAMLPLLDNQNSPRTIAESFTAGEVKNNGKLSNGDTISVAVNYNELLMSNAKINVQNPTLNFTVSGLKEKQRLDVFAGVAFGTEGTSPECTVSVIYNGGSPYGTLEMQLENGEILQSGYGERYFKNGEKVTLRVSEKALERLGAEYIIEETSREYTVQTDSKYILTADDLTPENRKDLDKLAEDFLKDKIEGILQNTESEKSERLTLLSHMTGVSELNLSTFGQKRIDKLETEKLNSAFAGIGEVAGNWGVTKKDQKSVYFFYDAEIAYYYKDLSDIREGDTSCALIVRIDDPRITPEGVMCSNMTFLSAKDIQSAYNRYITSSFEKLP